MTLSNRNWKKKVMNSLEKRLHMLSLSMSISLKRWNLKVRMRKVQREAFTGKISLLSKTIMSYLYACNKNLGILSYIFRKLKKVSYYLQRKMK